MSGSAKRPTVKYLYLVTGNGQGLWKVQTASIFSTGYYHFGMIWCCSGQVVEKEIPMPLYVGERNSLYCSLGGNHPRYQRILTLNRFIEAMMPENLLDIVRKSYTLSKTGHEGHYQGGHACLEEIYRDAKSWITSGVPTQSDWLKIFRNLDNMNQVRCLFNFNISQVYLIKLWIIVHV